MKTQPTILLTLSLWIGLAVASAQGTSFTYQGRVTSGGNAFNGAGQFKFALVTSTNVSAQATATANISGQFVVSYNVISGGNGYVIAPAVTISGGGGSGASAHAVISGGVVTSVVPDAAGSGYTNTPLVTIAPPPPNISFTTFWSNDDTSVNGSEPAAAVSVPVSSGLFTIVLGDTTLANMNEIDVAVFSQPKLQLRIWFNDGVNGFAALNPPQDLTPTPYAIAAATAGTAASLSGLLPASQVTGPLSSAHLNGIYSGLVSFSNTSNSFFGTFAGNGGALSNLSVNSLVAIATNVSITSWGNNQFGQQDVPAGLGDVLAVAAGYHSLALKPNGTVVAWGAGETNDPNSSVDKGQSIVPANLSNVIAVAAGTLHSLALKTDGTVFAWGWNDFGQTNVPGALNNVTAISGGIYHSLALKSDGAIVAWGTNSHGQLDIPPGLNNVKEASAGLAHNLVLRSNGTVLAWGLNDYGQTNVPAGLSNVVAISAGGYHNLAAKMDGTVVAWGAGTTNASNGVDFGQSIVPADLSNVVAVVAGQLQSLALKSDGTVVAWGDNQFGQTDVPPGLNNILALSPGSSAVHVLALRKRAFAPVALLDSDNTFNGNIQVNGALQVSGDAHVEGELTAGAGFRLNDGDMWLRTGDNKNSGLGWYGTNKPFGSAAPDGPVLYGSAGGALGTTINGQRAALTWTSEQRVGIGTTTPGARLSLGSDDGPTKLLLREGGSLSSGIGMGAQGGEFRFHLGGSGVFDKFSFLNGPAGTELFSIHSSGTVRLGFGAQLVVPGAVENLRILRGRISGSGGITTGTGFTVLKTGTGAYTITFTPGFSSEPTITATPQVGLARIATCTLVGSSSAGIRTFDSAGGAAVDQDFHFIAIGPR